MNNKLQELTTKLYDQGLQRGREESERMIEQAKQEAQQIVESANEQAQATIKAAQEKAKDIEKNTMTEIALAGKQAVAKIKTEIGSMIIAKSVDGGVKEATLSGEFVSEMLLSVAKNWNGADSAKVELKALLSEADRTKLDEQISKSATALLNAGIEVEWSKDVKSGFKVGAKDGGYYISFENDDFDALIKEYLREKVATLLYKE